VERIQQLVKNKSVILVGNSVELMHHDYGKFIDSHDIVVRFGRAVDSIADDKGKQLGSKTNIWVTGQFRAPIWKRRNKEFTKGKFKDVEILLNRCRGNFLLKDWVLEDHLPKGMPYTQMWSDAELESLWNGFGNSMYSLQLRPSAGFLTILYFIREISTQKKLSIIGYDFFHKSVKKNTYMAKNVKDGNGECDPHSWHLPLYTTRHSAHDRNLENQYVSKLERDGLLEWHALSDMKRNKVKYTGWMKGQKIIRSVARKTAGSKI